MGAIRGDYDGDLEVSESLDFGKSIRVFIHTFLDELHPLVFKGPLCEAARLAIGLGVDNNQLRFLSGETVKASWWRLTKHPPEAITEILRSPVPFYPKGTSSIADREARLGV